MLVYQSCKLIAKVKAKVRINKGPSYIFDKYSVAKLE